MFVPFEDLGKDAKVWIYQADRKLKEDEVDVLNVEAQKFINAWTAHGSDLQGSFKIVYSQFLVIGVDEDHSKASGCSIDSSVNFVRNMESRFNVSFLDRSKVALLIGDMVVLEDFNELKSKIRERIVKPDQITFNNYVTTKSEWETAWQSRIEDSWLKKYLN